MSERVLQIGNCEAFLWTLDGLYYCDPFQRYPALATKWHGTAPLSVDFGGGKTWLVDADGNLWFNSTGKPDFKPFAFEYPMPPMRWVSATYHVVTLIDVDGGVWYKPTMGPFLRVPNVPAARAVYPGNDVIYILGKECNVYVFHYEDECRTIFYTSGTVQLIIDTRPMEPLRSLCVGEEGILLIDKDGCAVRFTGSTGRGNLFNDWVRLGHFACLPEMRKASFSYDGCCGLGANGHLYEWEDFKSDASTFYANEISVPLSFHPAGMVVGTDCAFFYSTDGAVGFVTRFLNGNTLPTLDNIQLDLGNKSATFSSPFLQ